MTADLLGGHVLEGADDHALLGDRRAGLGESGHRRERQGGLGEAEIQELGAGFRKHDVAWF